MPQVTASTTIATTPTRSEARRWKRRPGRTTLLAVTLYRTSNAVPACTHVNSAL
jgi:hypothetical protein